MQPLHVGFTSDKGANTIDVHWYKTKAVLHHVSFPRNTQHIQQPAFHRETVLILILQVWDSNIIETAEEKFYDSEVDELIKALQKNITVSNLISSKYLIKTEPFLSMLCSCDDNLCSSLETRQTVWSNQAKAWEACSKTTCPDV